MQVKKNAMFGKKHPPEVLEKMRLAHIGKKRPPRSEEWNANLSASLKGKTSGDKNYFWNGGVKHNNGYLKIYTPHHPHADKGGYVYEHRLVMEKHLGRYLLPQERPHHINGMKTDNRIENLELFEGNGRHILEAGHIGRDPKTGKFIPNLLDGKEWREIQK
jgi:hypothetical protein